MSRSYQPSFPPATVADATDAWIAQRRAIIERDGHAIRAGAGLWIELQEANRPDVWQPINTPTGGQLYATAADRDAVLRRLWGHES
jgi:hypothetical protein